MPLQVMPPELSIISKDFITKVIISKVVISIVVLSIKCYSRGPGLGMLFICRIFLFLNFSLMKKGVWVFHWQ